MRQALEQAFLEFDRKRLAGRKHEVQMVERVVHLLHPLQQQPANGGHGADDRNAMLRDLRHRVVGIEPRQHDQRCAEHHTRDHPRHADAMGDRGGDQIDVVETKLPERGGAKLGGDQIGVRRHRALGVTGGSRGVADQRVVTVRRQRRRCGRFARLEEIVVADHRGARRCAADQDTQDIGLLAKRLVDMTLLLRAVDDREGLAIVRHEGELVTHDPGRDRHRDGPGFPDGGDHLHQFERIADIEDDPIAVTQAARAQGIGKTVAAFVEFAKRQSALAIDHGEAVRPATGIGGQITPDFHRVGSDPWRD